MAVNYELWLTDSPGARLSQIGKDNKAPMNLNNALVMECTKTANDVGALHMIMPWSFDRNLLQRDNMVQIWRAPTGGRLSMFQVYFVDRWKFSINQNGRKTVELWGAGPNDLFNRRHVANFRKDTEATAALKEADDLMKDVCTYTMVSVVAYEAGADTTARNWSTVSVQADLTLGPQVTNEYAWRQALDFLQDISAASQSAGTQVWFDMVPILGADSISFQFRTFIGQPGQDLTSIGVAFAADKGTLTDVSLEYDYSQERNYIYALGPGEASDRNIQTAQDDTRIGQSFYGRREGTVNATIDDDDAGVQTAANAALFAGRPRIRFEATPQDTAEFRFGRDWNWGDKVRSRFDNLEFDSIIKTVQLSVRNQRETIRTILEFEN